MTTRRWRTIDVLGESLRNAIAYWPRSCAVGVLLVGLMSLVGLSNAAEAQRALRLARDQQVHGLNVFRYAAPDGSKLPASGCQALADSSAVVSAGGLALAGVDHLTKAPGDPVSVYSTTGAFARVIDPATAAGWGGAVSASFATREGLETGHRYQLLRFGSIDVASTVDTSLRFAAASSAIFVPTPVADVDECWAELVPSAADQAQAIGTTALAGRGDAPVATRVLSIDDFTTSPAGLFESRASRFAWMWSAVVAAVVWGLLLWTRRSELSLYRALGVSRGQLTYMQLVEGLAVAAVATALAALVTVIAGAPDNAALRAALWHVAAAQAATASAFAVTSSFAGLGSPSAGLKDR